ncbi:Bug family tripartite tricarboxylate transporter substrate binding protein [Variovorax sp. VNK109]|uniref:Bug family tripartite tricarboxylate transporter substrate binding protein n=1 Tax=Variovorax sp. VNK109 TaxID=3400919 RepID=UPI003BFE240F
MSTSAIPDFSGEPLLRGDWLCGIAEKWFFTGATFGRNLACIDIPDAYRLPQFTGENMNHPTLPARARLLVALSLFAAPWLAPLTSQAQEAYPSKPIRLVVGFPPGGATDVLARVFATRLSEQLPQRMTVDNRPGAGANLAAENVARSAPDGYSVLFTHVATHGIGPAVYPKLPFDPIRDFKPVSLLAISPLVLMTHKGVPANNMAELTQWAKTLGRPLTIGYPGNGTSGHLSSALLAMKSGLNLTLVPYRGGAPATQDLLGGQIDLLFDPFNSALQQVRGGTAKALGVTSEERHAALPDTPALAETMPGFRVLTWYGMVVPAGTPQGIVDRLATESTNAVNNPGVRKQLIDMGMTPASSTPAQFGDWIRGEIEHWNVVARSANIKLE